MKNPYEILAEVLNKIPQGFTPAADNSHIRVLEWIFTPEEANLTSKLKLKGETVLEISERLNFPLKELRIELDIMSSRGLITSWPSKRGKCYSLNPFIVGIFEDQLYRMDEDFVHLIDDYFQKTKLNELMSTEPAIHRIIPVKKAIKAELEIHPYEEAEKMINNAKSWGFRDCICQKQQKLLGNECKFPLKGCLVFAPVKNAFEHDVNTKPISKEESLRKLYEAEKAGLIHSTMNTQESGEYICNCCTCCCNIIGGLVKWNQPNAIVKSNYVMSVDEENCIGCGQCIERCQVNALKLIEGKCIVSDRCIGCGVCAIICPENVLSLIKRGEEEQILPPETKHDWMEQKSISRNVDFSDLL